MKPTLKSILTWISSKFLLPGLLTLFAFTAIGQDCNLVVEGIIVDESSEEPLGFSAIFIEEIQRGAVSDSAGNFRIESICKGDYHFRFTHVGCETEKLFISISGDTSLHIHLHHHTELIDEVVIHGSKDDNSSQASNSISKEDISRESNKDLSAVLENITGVSQLKTGAGISKPVIHGLSGNRITILNNGIAQSGQQWGNDHAPEIDPFIADRLSVIKGVSALAYSGNSLGGIVMVEPGNISNDPHIHGEINYIFQSNGLGHTLNTRIEKKDKWASWRLAGTLKAIGDSRTPNYFLTNTGKREGNIALQLERKMSDKWNLDAYYSLFSTEIGILRGSHIGNTTDLEAAIGREVPFATEDNFSYSIQPPRQTVNHHFVKLKSRFSPNENTITGFKYGGQVNLRKEFDIRRGGRSEIPALNLKQINHFLEGFHHYSFKEGAFLKTGIQYNYTDNTNNPETGIYPLIPDYRSHQGSVYAVFLNEKEKFFYEFGGRYDLKTMEVIYITTSVPPTIERYDHTFHNFNLSAGAKYRFSDDLQLSLNTGYVQRAPEVNELYSSGLHQGVSGIEEGSPDLGTEKSLKLTLSTDWSIKHKVYFQGLAYYQNISNFIYLQPEDEFRLTIRGAFPVFTYQQTNASIWGVDLLLSIEPSERLKLITKYAFIRGNDLSNNLPLINMPSNNLSTSLNYSLNDKGKFRNTSLSVNAEYIFKQNRLEEEQDFLAPPDGYFLLGAKASTGIQLKKSILKLSLNAENILNSSYRDYLNRQRYFADEQGVNIVFRINYGF